MAFDILLVITGMTPACINHPRLTQSKMISWWRKKRLSTDCDTRLFSEEVLGFCIGCMPYPVTITRGHNDSANSAKQYTTCHCDAEFYRQLCLRILFPFHEYFSLLNDDTSALMAFIRFLILSLVKGLIALLNIFLVILQWAKKWPLSNRTFTLY